MYQSNEHTLETGNHEVVVSKIIQKFSDSNPEKSKWLIKAEISQRKPSPACLNNEAVIFSAKHSDAQRILPA